VQSLQSLQASDVSVLAVSGLQFDLSTPHGKMIASVIAAPAEFELDLIRERIKSGIAAAKARGKRRSAPEIAALLPLARCMPSVSAHKALPTSPDGATLEPEPSVAHPVKTG
jgi:hypothetical protein